MGTKRQGRYTVMFEKPPIIRSYAAIVGEKESEGPLGAYFDTVCEDPMMGQDSWEAAEGQLQYTAVLKALDKAFLRPEDIDYLLPGICSVRRLPLPLASWSCRFPILVFMVHVRRWESL